MQLALILMSAVAIVELLLYWRLWRWRRQLAVVVLTAVLIVSLYLVLIRPDLGSWVTLFFSLYRALNLLRIVKERIQVDYLYNSARRASAWLIAGQVIILGLDGLSRQYGLGAGAWLYVVALVQLLVVTMLLLSTLRHIRTTKPLVARTALAEKDLPTLTVAIPARNETDELDACLQSLVASTYPKLEIIVLDDCSQDKRTPEIIRGFAQAGIVFVAGEEPPGHWLAKNYAYKQLADQANGELILFCGTDTRFEPSSLNQIVETLLAKHKQMLSIMPRNLLASGSLKSLLIQPARYAWELALPRRLLRRPPVLSTCWLISAEALRESGGFNAVSRKIIPENYFARQTAKNADGYSFMQASEQFGVTSQKTFAEQRDTAVRTRYPQLHRRLELVALLGLAEFLALVWPFCTVVLAIAERRLPLLVIGFLGWFLAVYMHGQIVSLTYGRFLRASLWVLPAAAVYDLWLLNYSLRQYEFGEVLWKGRNVCIPVMRVLPSLSEDSARKS